MDRLRIELTADGSCIGNPGPGGWAVVLEAFTLDKVKMLHSKVLQGSIPEATNNISELTAVLEGLKAIRPSVKDGKIVVWTDSEYVQKTCWLGSKVKANKELVSKVKAEIERLQQQGNVISFFVVQRCSTANLQACDSMAYNQSKRETEQKIAKLIRGGLTE